MSEIMGGIKRLINRDDPHPDLITSRIQEQREREKGLEKKEKFTLRMSKLQRVILDLCVNNPSSYSATLDQILDKHFGKNKPTTKAMLNTVWRSVKSLKKKGYVELMPHRVRRVQLSETAQKIAREEAEK